MRKTYIERFCGSTAEPKYEEKLKSRFNRSNLSFKYKLLDVDLITNVKMQPALSLQLSPSGYDDPNCFVNGEFHPSKIRESSQFTVEITDFDVVGKLTESQKHELLKLMHEKEYYSGKYFSDYRRYHKKIIDAQYKEKIEQVVRLGPALIRAKGEKYYNNFLFSIKKEYEEELQKNEFVFTQWEERS